MSDTPRNDHGGREDDGPQPHEPHDDGRHLPGRQQPEPQQPDPQRRGHDVEIAALESGGTLGGFLLLGRWPVNTVEWAKFLVLAVRMAAVPGLLPTSTIYAVHDDMTERPHPQAVGIITAAGRALGRDALRPGALADQRPHGLVVLHPPSHTIPSDPEFDTASGCVFLPGLPHLGLDHRAAWAQAAVDGTVTQLVSRGRVDPLSDVDTAALSAFIAA